MKTSKTSIIVLCVVIVIACVFLILAHINAPVNSTLTNSVSTTTASVISSSTVEDGATNSSTTVDMSSWKTYLNVQPSFGIQYPADLTMSTSAIPTVPGPYLLDLQFPKEIYFSTVLKDEAYVIVTASSTCPIIEPGVLPLDKAPETIVLPDGVSFVRNQTDDVAAGNRYLTITYDTIANGLCYRITFFDHGANGAGLYLSDPTAIKAADAAHDAELANIEAVVSKMVDTFFLTSLR